MKTTQQKFILSSKRSSLMLAILAIAICLFSTSPTFAKIIVNVGGHDADFIEPGADSNYSFIATSNDDGTNVSGEYTDVMKFRGKTYNVHGKITCLKVSGNKAWIGGIINKGIPDTRYLPGKHFVTAVVDNGDSANDPPDQISFTFQANLSHCENQNPNFPLLNMSDGQVKIHKN